MANDTYTDQELWESAADARADRPKDPMMDDVESVQSKYHEAMAQVALAHQEEKERLEENRNINCVVMINGQACDPELELRRAELEGYKEEAYKNIKRICAIKLAGVLAHHLGKTYHVSQHHHA